MSEKNLRSVLFSAQLRSEVVTLKNGVQIKIKQVVASVGDEIMALMRNEAMPSGERAARMVGLRCENADGSPVFEPADYKTYGSNVAVDDPAMNEVLAKIQEFDVQTAKLYDEAKGK